MHALAPPEFPGRRSDGVGDVLRHQYVGSTVLVSGEVDAFTVTRFESILLEVVERGDIVELDLSEVSFFGSVGAEPLKNFSRLFSGRIVRSRAVDLVLGLLGIDLLTRD